MYFDTHAHLDDQQFREDQPAVLERARTAGVELILNAASDLASSKKTLELTRKYDFVYGAVGIHPHEAKEFQEQDLAQLGELAKQPRIVAIGEIGLDYHYDFSPRETQGRIFREMIRLAQKLRLPIVIHDREAHEDTWRIVQEEKAAEIGGVFHCYSGSWPWAQEIIKQGFYIALGGPVTFKNARKVVEVAQKVPLDVLLLETDCPYLAPVPYRGKRNEPAFLPKVAETIAAIKGISVEEVAAATTANAKKLFSI